MAVLCVCGVCIPYSALLPLLLMFIKPIWEFILKLIGRSNNNDEKIKNNEIIKETTDNATNSKIVKGIAYDLSLEDGEKGLLHIMNNGTTILRFTASWCKPCKQIEPLFNQLAKENENINFVNIDVDSFDELAAKYKALKIPLFILFKDAKEVERLSGSDENSIKRFIQTIKN